MKEAIKSRLQRHLPRLWRAYCVLKAPSSIKEMQWMQEKSEKARFRRCIKENKPYFGPIMAAKQGEPVRHAYMQALVEQESARIGDRPYRILEIGSWAGGSAITWASAVQTSYAGRGCVVCVDPWECYVDNLVHHGQVYQAMHEALNRGDIFKLFLHNIRASGYHPLVKVMRGRASDILPLLKPETFDLVFVDGAHDYAGVSADLKNTPPLIREGGIICGDDLELQLAAIDVHYAEDNAAIDYVCDPKTGKWYHPGVTLAVAESLGEVSVWEGFWAMRKTGPTWSRIVAERLDRGDVRVPPHLR